MIKFDQFFFFKIKKTISKKIKFGIMDETNETEDRGMNDANENNETGQRVQQNDADGNLIQCT